VLQDEFGLEEEVWWGFGGLFPCKIANLTMVQQLQQLHSKELKPFKGSSQDKQHKPHSVRGEMLM